MDKIRLKDLKLPKTKSLRNSGELKIICGNANKYYISKTSIDLFIHNYIYRKLLQKKCSYFYFVVVVFLVFFFIPVDRTQ